MEEKKFNEILNSIEAEDDENNVVEEKSVEEHHHHHRHHHHHHHSSKSRKNKNKKGNRKLKSFFKDNKKKLLKISGIILIVLLLVVIAVLSDVVFSKKQLEQSTENPTKTVDKTINVELPYFTDEVVLVDNSVVEYINSENTDSIKLIYDKYSNNQRLDFDVPVKLSYNIESIPQGQSVVSAHFEIADNQNLNNAKIYRVKNENTGVEVRNLKTNTTYYYKSVIKFSNGFVSTGQGSFKTADTPRIILVDGIVNFRDFGGWNTSYGTEVKQGLLYRGSELDGIVNPKYTITSNGITHLLTELDIRTDMDLRNEAEIGSVDSPLGNKVTHKIYNAGMYIYTFNSVGKASIKKIFTDLANEKNYPVYMHCTYGLDRTGTVCYLLGAILGMSEEDLMRDYMLSYFYHGWTNDEEMEDFITKLKRFEGDNIKEKSENFLYSAGVTEKEIASIRNIFIGD